MDKEYEDDLTEISLLETFADNLEEASLQRTLESKGIFKILTDNDVEILMQRLDVVPPLQDLIFQSSTKRNFWKKLTPAFQQTIYVEINAGPPSFLLELLGMAKLERIYLNFRNYFFFLFFELTEHFEKTISELSRIWELTLEAIHKDKIERMGQTTAIILRQEWKDKIELETLIENLRTWNIALNDINERSSDLFNLFNNQNETELLAKILKRTKNVGSFFFIERKYCKDWNLIWDFICKEKANHSFLIVSENKLAFDEMEIEKFKMIHFDETYFYYNYETLEEKMIQK